MKELLLQIIPVMIGVYLGFVVSNWSERSQKRQQTQVLVENLLSEIETNQQTIGRVMDYHKTVLDSSIHYTHPGQKIEKPTFFVGLRIMKLNNSVYQTGIQTGIINELPLEKIQAINRVYTIQKDYDEFRNLILANWFTQDFSGSEEGLRKLARLLSVTFPDIVGFEERLMDGYGRLGEMLEAR